MIDISLEQADAVIEGTLDAARQADSPPIAVVVLDRSGHVVAAKRQDGASMFRFDVAFGKAWGAAAFGQHSSALAAKAAQNPNFFAALSATSQGRLLPNPGGAVIHNSEHVLIGAVGVSGDSGANDEQYALAGIASANLS